MRKLKRAKIAPNPHWLQDQVWAQKMFCDSRVTITNTGQLNHPHKCAAVCVLVTAKKRAQGINAPDVMWACLRGIVLWNIIPK